MKAQNLGIDHEEFSMCILPQLEESFGISFQQADLAGVHTFGQLCAAVQAKLTRRLANDCTSQQAFYKARQAIKKYTAAEHISPDTALVDIFPSGRQRRKVAANIEQDLQMRLGILGMTSWQTNVGCLAVLVSLGCLFFNPLLALVGLMVAVVWVNLASQFGTSLSIHTMRDLAERMSTRHYQASRRIPQTVNPQEIPELMRQLFNKDYGIELHELTPDAIL
ncbi:acyl carrier protein [Hymenobacter fodinae]|uniref:Uncharacterized protein n=1 Tax=Hymenobacter fodinae TaxID=2510796 RepID=A0A4Z0P240_9BACT|nr:hypothetical protein [Hymenobacter fodinae]TGE04862.1 hypothetical protein EU556_22045 [Hymenobacter fodinae]